VDQLPPVPAVVAPVTEIIYYATSEVVKNLKTALEGQMIGLYSV